MPQHDDQEAFRRLTEIGGLDPKITQSLLSGSFGGDLKSKARQNVLGPGGTAISQLTAIGSSPFGLTPEQMNLLIENLTQILGGQQQQQVNVLKQSTAGQPQAVKTAALASSQNQFRGALQRGTTQIQAGGLDRQLQAILALLQNSQFQQQVKAQNQQSLFTALSQIGGGIAPFVLDSIFPGAGTVGAAATG